MNQPLKWATASVEPEKKTEQAAAEEPAVEMKHTPMSLVDDPVAFVHEMVARAVEAAGMLGLTIRIEHKPMQPLAMGNHAHHVIISPSHARYSKERP